MLERRKRIALYGGTFDPVHVGHLAVARGLIEIFDLDEVLFIPAHVAPHKRDSMVSPPLHRYAMLALATACEDAMRISTIELEAPERPYTVETVARFQHDLDEHAQLFFVMGADSWSEITTWREWERLLMMTDHLVVARPGYDLDKAGIPPLIRQRIVDLRGVEKNEIVTRLAEVDGTHVYVTDTVFMDVSATAIRESISVGHESKWRPLVLPRVADYITKYGLYKIVYETEPNR
jgi:nicotinate-nucleotide adenylyltransferase